MIGKALMGTAAAALIGSAGLAADRRSALFDAAVRCGDIADKVDRLACYDRTVEALRQAEQRREVAIIDRAQVRETKRTLFGLGVPKLSILAGADDGQEVDRLDGTVANASMGAGGLTVRLQEGGEWQQVDDNETGRTPRPGDKVTIKRAALGSFRMTVAGSPGIKVRRVR